jgi:DHA1 family inner membrane transport protein
VVVGAPVFAVLGAKLARRALLMGLIALFAVGNIASALAPGYLPLVFLRFLTGLPHGAYFGVAALVAASMVAGDKRAQAVSRMMLGLTIANVIGAPLATWFGQFLSWRAAYGTVGAIGAVTVVLLARYVPNIQAGAGASPLRELGALGRKQVWLTLGVAAIGSGGMFSVYTYVAPTLINVTGLPLFAVPIALSVWGIGMVLGNLIGARLADRALTPTIFGLLLWNAVILVLYWLDAGSVWMVLPTILLLGTGFALVPALQTRLMDVAADAQTLAASLNHSALNIANALGAWLGGLVIATGYGWAATGWVGAVLAVFGVALFAVSVGGGAPDSAPNRIAPEDAPL